MKDDLISRHEMFLSYQDLCTHVLCRECAFFNGGCMIETWIENFPSAQPEREIGKDVYWEGEGHCEFKCSVCGVEIGCVEGGDLDGGFFSYCPNCGADMRGNDDDV